MSLITRLGWSTLLIPGLVLALVISVAAVGIAAGEERLIGYAIIESLVVALLIGIFFRTVLGIRSSPFMPGASYAGKQVLEVGVALLGASVDLKTLLANGPSLIALIMIGVGGGIAVSYGIGKALGLGTRLSILVAVGNSICGNSAIAAVAPIIRAERKEVASSIALTAVLGVGMVVGLPLLIPLLNLTLYQYGVLAGMSVYAVPQVVAAAYPVSELSGDVATLVKLARVMLLGPVVLFFVFLFRQGSTRRGFGSYLPWFIVAFLLLATFRTLGILPEGPAGTLREIARYLTILAMAGLGLGVDLQTVRAVGARVGVAVVSSLVFMAGMTIGLMRILGL